MSGIQVMASWGYQRHFLRNSDEANMAARARALVLGFAGSMKEFEDTNWLSIATNSEGMYIWYLEGSKMVPIYGFWENLYEGDIYVILENYKMDDKSFNHNLHIWVGTGASEVDVTHAERHAASLDVWVRRRASLHWERQDQECEQFHRYFSPVLQYLPGKYQDYNKDSTQHDLTETLEGEVETDIEKSLFSVYVHRNMRKVKQVKCDMSSLNKRDPLILITGTDVVYALGRGSWSHEVLMSVAHTISFRMRMKSLGGYRYMEVVMLDNNAAIEDWDEFYKALGWTETDSFPPIPDGIEEKVESQDAPQLYEIRRNRRGHIYYGSMPFERNALNSQSLYILTKGKDDVCLWIGKKNQDRNKAKLYGLAKLREFTSRQIPPSKWPPWQHMTIIPEGLEPLSFKRHFHNWIGQD